MPSPFLSVTAVLLFFQTPHSIYLLAMLKSLLLRHFYLVRPLRSPFPSYSTFLYYLAASSTTLSPLICPSFLLPITVILTYLFKHRQSILPSYTFNMDSVFAHSRVLDPQKAPSSLDLGFPGDRCLAYMLFGLSSTSESEAPHLLHQLCYQAHSCSS